MQRYYLILVLLTAVTARELAAQTTEDPQPAWILYELGRAKLDTAAAKELGEAVKLFRQSIEQQGIFPGAEVALGDAYAAEGELILAERQYKKAYELRKSFTVPDEQYAVLYRLARLYQTQEAYKSMEDQLLSILQDQPYYSADEQRQFRASFQEIYRQKGLDQLFRLYRIERVDFARQAHAELGWFYYRSGRFVPALMNSLFALNIMVTNGVNELRRRDPGYEYTDLEDFLNRALSRPGILDYFSREGFFRSLYYLAATHYAMGQRGTAMELWEQLADRAGQYAQLARRQLQEPWVEPRIRSRD